MHDADHALLVVQHGVAGVAGAHLGPDLGDRRAVVDGVGLRAGDHGVLDVAAGEVEDAVEEERQVGREVAAAPRVGDDVREVPFGGGVLHVVDGFDPQGPQQQVRGLVEHPDQPPEDLQVEERRPRQAARDRFGPGDGEVFREQLPEHHLHERGQDQGEDGPDGDADRGGDPGEPEDVAEGLADQRFGDVADEQSGDGDAELRARQHERGAAGDGEGAARGAVPGARAGLEAGPVHRHEGEFLRDEVTGEGGDQEDHDDAEHQRQQSDQRRPAGEEE
ncbi:hypothetical protein BJF79_20500 [Actinomadura sp. CNU-125]|nr:hypothetical protein BJF79_20500 [Actinomadura sp. CNU-125]